MRRNVVTLKDISLSYYIYDVKDPDLSAIIARKITSTILVSLIERQHVPMIQLVLLYYNLPKNSHHRNS